MKKPIQRAPLRTTGEVTVFAEIGSFSDLGHVRGLRLAQEELRTSRWRILIVRCSKA